MDRPVAVIPGAMRSGTTSLARTLAQHPDAVLSPQKEVHFFDVHWDRGVGVVRQAVRGRCPGCPVDRCLAHVHVVAAGP